MLIKKLTLATLALLFAANLTYAQSSNLNTYDYIAMDDNVIVQVDKVDDVFAVGNNLSITTPILGTAHLVGKNIEISDDINQSAYVIGEQINVRGFISQSLYGLASNLTLNQTLGGDLRLAADNAYINGDIQGRMMAAITNVYIDSTIEGDVILITDNITFGPNAKINGFVSLYLPDDSSVDIPAYVVDDAKIEIIVESDEHRHERTYSDGVWDILAEILILALLALILAKVAPGWIQKACARGQVGWFKTSLRGIASLVVLMGIIVLSLITIIGIPIALLAILALIILMCLGWIICAYLCGNIIINKWGKDPEDSLMHLALTCLIGSAVITLITLIPWVGWLLAVLIVLYGLGCSTPYTLKLNKE